MPKITLSDVGNFNSTTLTVLAANNAKIEAALENTLSRDGTSPNQMTADLDMNGQDVLNVTLLETDSLLIGGVAVDLPALAAEVEADRLAAEQAAIDAEAARDAIPNLNVVGGFTIDTTAPLAVNWLSPFGGTYVGAHRFAHLNSSAASYNGSRSTMFINMEGAGNAGGDGIGFTHQALGVSVVKTDWKTTTEGGEFDGINLVLRNGRKGDSAAYMANLKKVFDGADLSGMTGVEIQSVWTDGTSDTAGHHWGIKATTAAMLKSSDLRARGVGLLLQAIGGTVPDSNGETSPDTAIVVNGRSSDGGEWLNILRAGDTEATADLYFQITGSRHADGGGIIRAGLGAVTTPTYSFIGNTGLGIYRAAADVMGITSGGSVKMLIGPGVRIGGGLTDQGTGTLNLLGKLYVDNTFVVGARATGWARATGTYTRTTFVTSTVTLQQLAERVAALIEDLHSGSASEHGIIGP